MIKHILVERIPQMKFSSQVNHVYQAFLSYDPAKEATGTTEDEAVENLCLLYREAINLPVFGREGRAGGNKVKREEKASPEGLTCFLISAFIALLFAAVVSLFVSAFWRH